MLFGSRATHLLLTWSDFSYLMSVTFPTHVNYDLVNIEGKNTVVMIMGEMKYHMPMSVLCKLVVSDLKTL